MNCLLMSVDMFILWEVMLHFVYIWGIRGFFLSKWGFYADLNCPIVVSYTVSPLQMDGKHLKQNVLLTWSLLRWSLFCGWNHCSKTFIEKQEQEILKTSLTLMNISYDIDFSSLWSITSHKWYSRCISAKFYFFLFYAKLVYKWSLLFLSFPKLLISHNKDDVNRQTWSKLWGLLTFVGNILGLVEQFK